MIEGSPLFPTTNWQDLAIVQSNDEHAQSALERLCKAYWFPVYAYIRSRNPDSTQALDLTQSFFGRLLEKESFARVTFNGSRFRCFLLAACRNFLTDMHRLDTRQSKRPPGGWVDMDAATLEARFASSLASRETPEFLFEREWALTTIDRAFRAVEAEYRKRNKGDLFDCLHRFLDEDPGALSHRETGERLGLSESAVKTELHRLRQKLREALKGEVSSTLASDSETEDELATLLTALGK